MLSKSQIFDFIHSGAIISTPEKKIILAWGARTRSARYDPHSPITFYCPDFFLTDNKPWVHHEHIVETSIDKLSQLLLPLQQALPKRQWLNPFKEHFRNALEQLHTKIYSGEIEKAVPFIFEISRSPMSPSQLVASLCKALEFIRHSPIHLYGHWSNNEGILGATPEVLFSLAKTEDAWVLKTSALAGTKDSQRKDIRMEHDLKTHYEHALVISGIQESLKAYGKIELGALEELKLPKLTHLKTPITLKLKHGPDVEDIVARLHPTPALGAFPRLAGIAWLKAYQRILERKYFGAPIGYVKPREQISNVYVAIRNYQWDHAQIQIGAGCGIVAGSDFNDEWQEIGLKIKSIKDILAL